MPTNVSETDLAPLFAARSRADAAKALQDIGTAIAQPAWPRWLVNESSPLMEFAVSEGKYPLFEMLCALAFRDQWTGFTVQLQEIIDRSFREAISTMSNYMDIEAEAFPAAGFFVEAIASYLWRSPQSTWESQVSAFRSDGQFGPRAKAEFTNAGDRAFGEWERQQLSAS